MTGELLNEFENLKFNTFHVDAHVEQPVVLFLIPLCAIMRRFVGFNTLLVVPTNIFHLLQVLRVSAFEEVHSST